MVVSNSTIIVLHIPCQYTISESVLLTPDRTVVDSPLEFGVMEDLEEELGYGNCQFFLYANPSKNKLYTALLLQHKPCT